MPAVAMHISNGIIDNQTALLFAAGALAGLALCFVMGRRELDDRLVPMAGLVAAFIFAVQMLNFQVLPGVSGHLLGGTLAAILVGPYLGAICVSIVLVVQALIFSDGGVTALGLNVTNMALLATAAGYLLVVTLLRVLPRTTWALTATAVIACVVSVTVASLLLAGVVSNFASAHPDGLDAVARQGCTFDADDHITGGTCMAQSEAGNQTKDSPLAGYGLRGVTNGFLSTGLSGVIGVVATF